MLRKTLRRLIEGEQKLNAPTNSSSFIGSGGGLPFYGNIYAGRVSPTSWTPPKMQGSGLLQPHKNLWDDPVIREKIRVCPYFALCDQVLWQNMDPSYLDPGLLTTEEHQLLLLFSRAYFDKWRSIHSRPEVAAPRIRITYGHTALLTEMCNFLDVPTKVTRSLIKEFLMDDAGLIGMNPDLWQTAYLDPANRDQLSGRILEYAGLTQEQRQKFYLLVTQMRRLRIRRKDLNSDEPEEIIIPYHEAPTLYDLHLRLGLEPYSGQLKTYDFIDDRRTAMTLSINDEDTYFDYLVCSFYKPILANATLSGDMADTTDCTTRYSLTVEPVKARDAAIGKWF